MSRPRARGGLAAVFLALACSSPSGSPPDASAPGDGASDVPIADAPAAAEAGSVGPGTDAADAPGIDAGGDLGPAARDVAAPDVATIDAPPDVAADAALDAPSPDAGGPCGNAACVGSNWAQWPMPNSAADVTSGAPNPAMLVDNGDDTVTDKVTGLMWQRTASATDYRRAEAQARCERLRAGGHDDWRVPSVIEAASILDFDHVNSSLDAKAFPDSPIDLHTGLAFAYFGTTTMAGTPAAGWLVDFSFGDVVLDTTEQDRGAFLRCVRGPRAPATDTSAGRYDLSVDGVARDLKTGLTWQRVAARGRRKLSDARTICATASGLPGTGWRLPTIKELMTLVDFAKPGKFRLDEGVFDTPTEVGDPYSVFWSATAVAGKRPYSQYTSGVWGLYFDSGRNVDKDATGYSFVRCVR